MILILMMMTRMRMTMLHPASLRLESVNFLDISTQTTALSMVRTTYRPHISPPSLSYHYCFCALTQLDFGHFAICFLHYVKITTYLDRHFQITAIY